MISVIPLISLSCGARLGGVCLPQGWEGAHRAQQAAEVLQPQPSLPSGQQNMLSAAFCLLSTGQQTLQAVTAESSCFPTYLLTAFLALQASALAEHVTKEEIEIHSMVQAGIQNGTPGHLHFTFSFICAHLLCLSFVLICLWDYRTPALALPLWLHKLGRFKCFSARFLQTCFFSCVYNLESQYVSAFSTTCKQNWIHIDIEGWIGFYWQILKLTFITSQRSQVNFFHKNRLKAWPR